MAKNWCEGYAFKESNKLVNGLVGEVKQIMDETVKVFFPSVDVLADIKRILFTVYNPEINRNVAERLQFPLKLAYALTIHKSQGMTLDSVEVDCRHIFQPGQLAVAMGRVKTEEGLRVINFSPGVVMKQPKILTDFLSKESKDLADDLSCCQKLSAKMATKSDVAAAVDTQNVTSSSLENDVEEDDDFDSEFDELISSEFSQTRTFGFSDIELPELPLDFDTTSELEKLLSKEPFNTFQHNINELIGQLLAKLDYVIFFCRNQWKALIDIYDKTVSVVEPAPIPEAQLTSFYENCQQYLTSDEYKDQCFRLFDVATGDFAHKDEGFSVCFNLFVALRKTLLKQKTENLPVNSKSFSKRALSHDLSDTARGKITYIGGYAVAKLRYKYCRQITSLCHKTSADETGKFELAKNCLEILDGIKQSEQVLQESSQDIASLQETARKQNLNRGLTNISDEAFSFVSDVVNESLNHLTGTALSVHGTSLYEYVFNTLKNNMELYSCFLNITKSKIEHLSYQSSPLDDAIAIQQTMDHLLQRVVGVEILYEEILDKILSVLTKQHVKDILTCLDVQKKMEHRKQIQIGKGKKESGIEKLTVESIRKDTSDKKQVSHYLLKATVIKDKKELNKFKLKDLQELAKAYACSTKGNKSSIIDRLSVKIQLQEAMTVPTIFTADATTNTLTSHTTTSDEQPSTSASYIPPAASHGASESVEQSTEQEHAGDEERCGKCGHVEKKGEQWICCDILLNMVSQEMQWTVRCHEMEEI